MRAYSTDLREKIVMAYESGEGTLDKMAATFEVDRRTVSRLLHRYRTGEGLAPKPHGGGYPASLDDKRLGLLRRQVEHQPDATLEELAAYLKKRGRVEVHPSTVCRALQRLGLPRKKSLAASGRVEADRRAFRRRVARLDRRRLVFTDETGFHLAMTRAYGRAARGERVNQSVPRDRGRGVTLIGSLGLRGLLAPFSLEGAVDTVAFDSYVSRVPVSAVAPLRHRAARQPAGAPVEPSRGGCGRGQGGGDVAAGILARLLAYRGVLVEGQGAGARVPATDAEGVGRGAG